MAEWDTTPRLAKFKVPAKPVAKKPAAPKKKLTKAQVDATIEKWKKDDRVDEDDLELEDMIEAYHKESEDFLNNPGNFAADADFYHTPSRDAVKADAKFDAEEIENVLRKQMQKNQQTKGTAPFTVPDGMEISPGKMFHSFENRETVGLMQPIGFDILKCNEEELRTFPPHHFYPSGEKLYEIDAVKNLEHSFTSLVLHRQEKRIFALTHNAIAQWHNKTKGFVSEAFKQQKYPFSEDCNIVVFIYYLSRPIFVHCIWRIHKKMEHVKKKRAKQDVDGNVHEDQIYEWIGHFYSTGREIIPPPEPTVAAK